MDSNTNVLYDVRTFIAQHSGSSSDSFVPHCVFFLYDVCSYIADHTYYSPGKKEIIYILLRNTPSQNRYI